MQEKIIVLAIFIEAFLEVQIGKCISVTHSVLPKIALHLVIMPIMQVP